MSSIGDAINAKFSLNEQYLIKSIKMQIFFSDKKDCLNFTKLNSGGIGEKFLFINSNF